MKRFLEIDVLRGIAICMVVIFHFIFSLHFFGVYEGLVLNGWCLIFGRIAATLFVMLAGSSLYLSITRTELRCGAKFAKYLFRGLMIFCLGLVITLVTWIYPHEGVIVFGVLHLIGVSVILVWFFRKYFLLNGILGALILAFGFFARMNPTTDVRLFLLGFPPEGFYTLDYFPLAPWFGVFLIGMFFARGLYPNYRRRFEWLEVRGKIAQVFGILGQNTLLIYFVHLPIILLGLKLFGVI